MNRYSILFPKQYRLFDEEYLTFTINYIRSRRPSVIYFTLHCYDINDDEILVSSKPVYTSERQVVGTSYGEHTEDYADSVDFIDTFQLSEEVIGETVYVQIELFTLGIDSENPLYFREMMLQEGTVYNGYHEPYELDTNKEHTVELTNNMYSNLYTDDGTYLQVIRPNKEMFTINTLNKAKYTILAPHFIDEDDVDNHVAVFFEAMKQTEQKIDVLR